MAVRKARLVRRQRDIDRACLPLLYFEMSFRTLGRIRPKLLMQIASECLNLPAYFGTHLKCDNNFNSLQRFYS